MIRALAILLFIMAGAIWWLVDDRAELRAEIRQKDARIKQADIARDVHRQYVQRTIEEQEQWQETLNELRQLEGRDAPLSDHMRTAIDRVYP